MEDIIGLALIGTMFLLITAAGYILRCKITDKDDNSNQ